MAKLVSKTYGDALFELAVESGQLDSFLEEARGVLKRTRLRPLRIFLRAVSQTSWWGCFACWWKKDTIARPLPY